MPCELKTFCQVKRLTSRGGPHAEGGSSPSLLTPALQCGRRSCATFTSSPLPPPARSAMASLLQRFPSVPGSQRQLPTQFKDQEDLAG